MYSSTIRVAKPNTEDTAPTQHASPLLSKSARPDEHRHAEDEASTRMAASRYTLSRVRNKRQTSQNCAVRLDTHSISTEITGVSIITVSVVWIKG